MVSQNFLKPVTVVFLALILNSPAASAHTFGQTYTLPLPFWLYAWGAAATLIISFVVFGFALHLTPQAVADSQPKTGLNIHPSVIYGLRILGVLSLVACIVTGIWGSNNPYGNFNMTFFWVIFILGFSYLTIFFGNIYDVINPLQTLSRAIATVFPTFAHGRFTLPPALYYWPVVILYGLFIWAELFGRCTPIKLAWALCAYSALTLLAVYLWGAKVWFSYGEMFSVWFAQISKMASINWVERPNRQWLIAWRPLFSGLVHTASCTPVLLLFILFMLSATAFDGLHETRVWTEFYWKWFFNHVLSHYWGNDTFVAFPKLLAYYPYWQVFWLSLSPFVYALFYFFGIFCVWIFAKRQYSVKFLALHFSYSLLPIVMAYHITHYYTLIQTQGVKIFALASDPLGHGADYLGTKMWFYGVIVPDTNTSWHVQVFLLVSGHIISVYIAHIEALRLYKNARIAGLSQLPMLGLMIGFTVFGLWVLSLPLGSPQ